MNKESERVNRYAKEHCRGVYLRFNLRTDADILARLDKVGNKQGYIKQLIRRDLYDKRTERNTREHGEGTKGSC